MKKPSCFLAVFLYSPAFAAHEIKPLPQIEVSSPADRAEVEGLNNTLSALSEKVAACVNAGGKSETCRCSYPKELNAMRTAYAATIKKNPPGKTRSCPISTSMPRGATSAGPWFSPISGARV